MLTMEPELRPYSALKVGIVDLELVDGVDGGLEGDLVLIRIAQIDAVDHEVDAVLTGAGGVEGKRSLAAQGRGQKAVYGRSDGTGGQKRKVDEMASIKGNLLHGMLIDYATERRRAGIDQRGSRPTPQSSGWPWRLAK